MALMTMIARVVDGLPLVGSMQEDEQVKLLSKNVAQNSFFLINNFQNNFSQEEVFWNIKIKLKCFLEN